MRPVLATGYADTSGSAIPIDGSRPCIALPRRRREIAARRLTSLARAADIVAAALTMVVILWLSRYEGHVWVLLACDLPVVLLSASLAGLGRSGDLWLRGTTVDELPMMAQAAAVLTLVLAAIDRAVVTLPWGLRDTIDLWVGALVALIAGRVLVREVARRWLATERCIVIADARQSARMRERLDASGSRFDIVGALELSGGDVAELSRTTLLHDLVDEYRADRVIIAPSSCDAAGDLVRLAKTTSAHVSLLPGVFDLAGPSLDVTDINGVRLVHVHPFGMSRAARVTKRTFDVIVAGVTAVLLSPILIAIAIAIKIDTSGSVLFKQTRVGRDGDRFVIFKFRSMVSGAEGHKERLRSRTEFGEGLFKIRNDPRVTRVGRFLRRSSLDELPQIFNVLRGDMSVVGPRPLVIDEDDLIAGLDRSRLSFLPGITGPWQVMRTRASKEEMVEIDYRYAAHWSLWLDLKIVAATFSHIARRGNL